MDLDPPRSHLNRISTPWTLVRLAHEGSGPAAADAQRLLLQRYWGAAYRYLLGALRDEEAALELLQEFALRFLRGDFRRADPAAGRFRDYLRAALIHLVADYHRQRRNRPQSLPEDVAAPAVPTEADAVFLHGWREELISRAWDALAAAKPTFYAVLLCHVENPELSSPRLAERLAAQLGTPFTAARVRVTLQRARARFAELLLEEVAHSLGECNEADLNQELRTLKVLELCAPALAKRKRRPP
jgi:RNA polymerase sigma-70 factor (ECF subfamily)